MKNFLFLSLLMFTAACANGANDRPSAVSTRIDVIETPQGLVAIPPTCPRYDDPGALAKMENDPMPQLGCATARNLAAQIVNPADLVRGELKPDKTAQSNATVGASAIKRYHEGKVYVPKITPAVTEGGSE